MRIVPPSLRRVMRASVEFWRDRRANTAITFAFASIPLITFIGAAMDYSRASSVKVQLQAALDATALMMAKTAASMSSSQLQTTANSYFLAQFNVAEATNISFNATYSNSGGSNVVATGSADLPTVVLNIVGISKITLSGSSTAKWGTTRLRVALVLDNTGSMASAGKMDALKTATKNLLSQLQAATSVNGDVYVSIIPFSKDVNAGATNYTASWIDWTEWDSDNRVCQGWGWGSFCFGTWVAGNHNNWNGCVTDRGNSSGPHAQNYDQNVTAPVSGVTASKYPAEQYSNCPRAMMGLNYDWTAMNNLVDQMYPAGSTNQPIGLVWGWQSLVGGGPLTAPAKDPNYTYQDVIVLMSDGLNTQDRWYGNGSSTSTSVDNRMYDSSNSGAGTCANIKAAGITIYAIHVNTDSDPLSTLLQNCASSTDKFWMVTSANGIGTVFNAIGTNLTKLRIAQ
jgi:Flp pilus assembly protein TadG